MMRNAGHEHKESNVIRTGFWRAALAAAALAIAGCQTQAGAGPDSGPPAQAAPGKSSGRVYAPQGTDGATVSIRPEGDIVIAAVNGDPVMRGDRGTVVTAGAAGDEFAGLRLPPGNHILSLSMLGTGGDMVDVSVNADTGEYVFAVLEAVSGGQPQRVLAVIQGGSDGRIIASSAPALVGRTRTEALRLLAASPEERRQILAAEKPGGTNRAEQAKAYFSQGQQYLQQGQQRNALRAFDGAIEADPGFAAAHVFRGIVLTTMKRAEEALAAFDAAIAAGEQGGGESEMWLAWPYFEKGKVLMAVGRLDEAETALDRSIALKPAAPGYAARANLYFVLGQTQRQQGNEDRARDFFEKTRRDADAGLALADDDVTLWSIKSGAHFGLGDGAAACRAAEKACEFGNCSIVKQYKQCQGGS